MSTAQVAQDATQVAQDVFNKFKKCLKNEQKVKVNPYHFASFKKILQKWFLKL